MILEQESKQRHEGSKIVTENLVHSIIKQETTPRENDEKLLENSMIYKEQKREKLKEKVHSIHAQLSVPLLRAVNQARDKSTSSCLPALPLKVQGFDLIKAEFRDTLHLRNTMPLTMLPTSCSCGQRFNVAHFLTCEI